MVYCVAGTLDIFRYLQSCRILWLTGSELLNVSTAMTDFDGKLWVHAVRCQDIWENISVCVARRFRKRQSFGLQERVREMVLPSVREHQTSIIPNSILSWRRTGLSFSLLGWINVDIHCLLSFVLLFPWLYIRFFIISPPGPGRWMDFPEFPCCI